VPECSAEETEKLWSMDSGCPCKEGNKVLCSNHPVEPIRISLKLGESFYNREMVNRKPPAAPLTPWTHEVFVTGELYGS
jgi:hypothetical protein